MKMRRLVVYAGIPAVLFAYQGIACADGVKSTGNTTDSSPRSASVSAKISPVAPSPAFTVTPPAKNTTTSLTTPSTNPVPFSVTASSSQPVTASGAPVLSLSAKMRNQVEECLRKGESDKASALLEQIVTGDNYNDLKEWATRELYKKAHGDGTMKQVLEHLKAQSLKDPGNMALKKSIAEGHVSMRDWKSVVEIYEDMARSGSGDPAVQSCALVRLTLWSPERQGVLAFGSADPEGFTPDMGPELVSFLARVVERTAARWPSL